MSVPDDDPPTPEELTEAEALAQALERGHDRGDVPEDALATAALLRFSNDGGALAPESNDRILAELLAREAPRPARRPLRLTILGLLGVAAAGAASIVLVVRGQAPEPLALPAPPRALLEAQITAANVPSSLSAIDAETAKYRGVVYAKLRERYGK